MNVNPDGSKRYVLNVTSDYTEADATAVGAAQVAYDASTDTAVVDSHRDDFVEYVEGGIANANILWALPNCDFLADNESFPNLGNLDVTVEENYIPGRMAKTWDAFNENSQFGMQAMSAVKLNPDPVNPTTEPYAPPTLDASMALTGTVTWDGTTTVVTTVPADAYKGAMIKLDADTQEYPYFRISAISGNNLTIENPEGRTIPTGAAGSSILLQGSGVKVGIISAGMPSLINFAFFTGKNGTLHEAYRKWNTGQDFVPDGDNVGDVASVGNGYDGTAVDEVGGVIGVSMTTDEAVVWDRSGEGTAYSSPFCDGSERAVANDVEWPATPVSTAGEYELDVTDATPFKIHVVPWLPSIKFPVQAVRINKLDTNGIPYEAFKIVDVNYSTNKITIEVRDGQTTPPYSAGDKSSSIPLGRVRGIASHAQLVHYMIQPAWSSSAKLDGMLRALWRADADGINIMIVVLTELQALGETAYGRVLGLLNRAVNKAFSQGIVTITTAGSTGENRDRFGYKKLLPQDLAHVIPVQGYAPRDFNPYSPNLSDWTPDPDKSVQSATKNLIRPMAVYWEGQSQGPAPAPGQQSVLSRASNFGSYIKLAGPAGAIDLRYTRVAWDANCQVCTNLVPNGVAATPRVQGVDIGFHALSCAVKQAASHVAAAFAVAFQAYKRENGSAPTAAQLQKIMFKSALEDLGPSTDDFIFANMSQQRLKDGKPVSELFYPKTPTQQALPAGVLTSIDLIPEEDGELQFLGTAYGNVLDTQFPWSKPGKTATMGHGVVDVKKAITEATS